MDINFFASPQKDEVIKTTIHINQNSKPAIIGNVVDDNEKPIKDAFLIAYEINKKNHKIIEIGSFAYTDEWGSFVLAPLKVDALYNIKVTVNHEQIRDLEIEGNIS
ncbi:MAG: hypothetical protein R3Y12_03435 [Clostridia bacterium]